MEEGKTGKPLNDLSKFEFALALKIYPGLVDEYHHSVLAVAAEFEKSPEEVQGWEWDYINKILLVRQARREADDERMKRSATRK